MTVAALILFGLTGYVGAARWQFETVTNVNPGTSSIPCLKVNNGKAHISFYDASAQALKYATNSSGSWVVTTIPGTSGTVADTNTSLDKDDNGKVYIGYQGANGDLKLATNDTGTWATSVVDAGVWPVDIILGYDNNQVVMIYFNSINFDIMMADNDSGSWVKTVILNGGLASPTGQLPGYALGASGYGSGSSGKLFVSYYDDATPDSIRYVTDESGTWQSYLVDTIGLAAGWRTSLRLDDNHAIHLTYYNWANDQLKYATNASGAWVKTVLSGSGETNVWDHNMDFENNKVYVSYTSGGLKFTSNMTGSWQTEVVEAGGTQGRSSIFTDNRLPHISYLNYTGGGGGYDLKYAKMNCIQNISGSAYNYNYGPAFAFSAAGGPGSITITAATSDCSWWQMASNNDWISITSGYSGTGSATVTYSVAANTTGSHRKGTITIEGQTFTVRQAGPTFTDVFSENVFTPYIYSIFTEGITVGCGSGMYCPSSNVTRGQMAAFIIRSIFGENFTYTTTPYFSDVPSGHGFFKYVQKMRDEGITAVTGTYMVDDVVTRGQMAAFIIRSKFGEDFTYITTPYFSDVPSGHGFFKYVQKMKDEGITAVMGTYMVDDVVTREQMAAFLGRAFLGME
jgi:hypothetical protein